MNRILSLIVTILFALCIEAGIFMLIAHWWGMTAAITGGSRNLMGVSVELCDSKEEKLFIRHSMKISSEKFDFSIE